MVKINVEMKENVLTRKLECQLMKLACILQLNVQRISAERKEKNEMHIWNEHPVLPSAKKN